MFLEAAHQRIAHVLEGENNTQERVHTPKFNSRYMHADTSAVSGLLSHAYAGSVNPRYAYSEQRVLCGCQNASDDDRCRELKVKPQAGQCIAQACTSR